MSTMLTKAVIRMPLRPLRVASSFSRLTGCRRTAGISFKQRHRPVRSDSRMVHQSLPLASHGSESTLKEEQQQQPSTDYKDAIRTLNTLQSNITTLERAKKFPLETTLRNTTDTIKYLARLGITLDDVHSLNVIHVSGTKGKGSTCAFSESIFRKCGLRTGLYSSPHIVAVRERIRINGQPLSEASFASYFWEVYDCLLIHRKTSQDMPAYFKFLTVMAFYVFLKEKVEVAIIEVGIGGQYDCTNAIRKPVVCGVTSLGLDHTKLLGSTLDRIAWQKAGIFKPGVPAVTAHQKEEAMQVLQDRSARIGAPLSVAPPLESHHWYDLPVVLGLAGEVQQQNASVAVQLVLTWLQQLQKRTGLQQFPNLKGVRLPLRNFAPNAFPGFDLMCSISEGLRDCRWPGRYQILRRGNVVYFIDGAHTPESMQKCVEWFIQSSSHEKLQTKGHRCRVLLFNSTGDRSSESLLTPLLKCSFDYAIFCPNIVSNSADISSDMASMMVSRDQSLDRCLLNQKTWLKLASSDGTATRDQGNGAVPQCVVLPCISDAISVLSSQQDTSSSASALQLPREAASDETFSIHVLVVGSLHLVGGVLSILDPELKGSDKQEACSPSG